MASGNDVRVVLVGKTGSGKSSTGNAILGREAFEVDFSPVSVTKQCEKNEVTINGKNISVVDTPGLFNTSLTEEELRAEIGRSVYLSSPGPHVFLLMIRLCVRFTEEEKNTVKWLQENFGEEALKKFTMVIFTGELKGELADLQTDCLELQKFITNFPHKYYVCNQSNHFQPCELIKRIEDVVVQNEGLYYPKEKIAENERKVQREIEKQNKMKEKIITATFIAACTACGVVMKYVWPAVLDCFISFGTPVQACVIEQMMSEQYFSFYSTPY